MRLLLDTHALIWWALDLPKLGRAAYAAIAESHTLTTQTNLSDSPT